MSKLKNHIDYMGDMGGKMDKLKKIYRAMLVSLPIVLFFSYYPVIRLGENSTMNFELSLPLIWLVVFDGVTVLILAKMFFSTLSYSSHRRGGITFGSRDHNLNQTISSVPKGQVWTEPDESCDEAFSLTSLCKTVYGSTMKQDRSEYIDSLKRRRIGEISLKLGLALFPVYVSISILWSKNLVRGVLVCGILWLIIIAVFGVFKLGRIVLDYKFKVNFLRGILGGSLAVAIWCLVQCVLDVAGVSRECTLLCAGCTYNMFGFPHPNGFAIEPQFMGNLMLMPIFVTLYLLTLRGKKAEEFLAKVTLVSKVRLKKKGVAVALRRVFGLSFIFMATLFLTFSRGAIYAFLGGLVLFTIVQALKRRRKLVLMVWPMAIFAFLFTLNLQGVFTVLSPTDDTYYDGVARVINHLTLGVVDIRGHEETGNLDSGVSVLASDKDLEGGEIKPKVDRDEAVFDGYVAESTDIRMKLTRGALRVWGDDFRTMVFGVGIGGAGEAMYLAGETKTPKEIVQNEYVSLLLETGLVGAILATLLVLTFLFVIRKSEARGVLTALILAYSISLCFFAGLPNALQIYLLPGILAVLLNLCPGSPLES
ncbi:MAG: O-antigen ligase family protein [Candidatus Saccharibacteria bacterium]|nr:O-antigen ligase family protein [Candidatus Saccharibacteria bacterium]